MEDQDRRNAEMERLYRTMCDDGDPIKGIVWAFAIVCMMLFIVGSIGLIITLGNDWP